MVRQFTMITINKQVVDKPHLFFTYVNVFFHQNLGETNVAQSEPGSSWHATCCTSCKEARDFTTVVALDQCFAGYRPKTMGAPDWDSSTEHLGRCSPCPQHGQCQLPIRHWRLLRYSKNSKSKWWTNQIQSKLIQIKSHPWSPVRSVNAGLTLVAKPGRPGSNPIAPR